MKIFLTFILFYFLVNTVIYSVEIKRIRPSEEITIFGREYVDFMVKATDNVGLAYSQWSVNGKKNEKHIMTGKISTDNLSINFPNVGKYYVTVNISNVLGESSIIIWKVTVEKMNILAKDDFTKISKNNRSNRNDKLSNNLIVENISNKSTYFNIRKNPNFVLPMFNIEFSSSYFLSELDNFDKTYNESGLIQFGVDFSIKLFSLNQERGIYLGLGYNYLNKHGNVINANLKQTETKSTWSNHKINLFVEYRFALSSLFTLSPGIGSSYYLISEEKKYSQVEIIEEKHLGFISSIALSFNIFNPISLFIKAQYDYIPVKLKNYGNDNLGGIGSFIGIGLNF